MLREKINRTWYGKKLMKAVKAMKLSRKKTILMLKKKL